MFSENKRVENLRYLHRNPVACRLVREPGQWKWSSYRHCAYDDAGAVVVNDSRKAEMKVREIS